MAQDERDARLQALEARVAALETEQALRALKARYAALVDARFARGARVAAAQLAEHARAAAALFCEDAEWDGGPALGVARGREEIAARLAAPTLRFARHYFVNPQFEVRGAASARARWELFAPCTTQDGTPHWMAGFEDDSYECVNGVWLHARMKLTTLFMAPLSSGWRKIYS